MTSRGNACGTLLTLTILTLLTASRAGAQQRIDGALVLHLQEARNILAAERSDLGVIKCGTPAVLAGLGSLRSAGSTIPLQTLVFDHALISPGGGFRLHYSTTGDHAVPAEDTSGSGVPDFVETAAVTFDSVAQGYRTLGWREPLQQATGYYEVYFIDFSVAYAWGSDDIYGITWPAPPTSALPPYTSASYIELNNRFDSPNFPSPPLESMLVTIAHEYHHAVQFAYHFPLFSPDFYDFTWFAEASAVYFEEIFFDDINDYYFYVPFFMEAPQTALTSWDGLHKYGAALWPLYLDRLFGADANRQIWTLMAEEAIEPVGAHQIFFGHHQRDWLSAWGEFTHWMLYTGPRADPARYFPEGSAYPPVATEEASLDQNLSFSLPLLAARYYTGITGDLRGGTSVRLQPIGAGAAWGVGVAGLPETGPPTPGTPGRSPGEVLQGVSAELFDWDRFPRWVRWAWTGDNRNPLTGSSVNRSAELEGRFSERLFQRAAGDQPLIVFSPYPNPFRPDGAERMYFAFELVDAGEVRLEVVNLAGDRLWSSTLPPLQEGVHFTDQMGAGWDGRDRQGRLVPSGIYLLIARSGAGIQATRFSVIR